MDALVYFEMFFNDPAHPIARDQEPAMCGKGIRIPTVKEANVFYQADVSGFAGGRPIVEVHKIKEQTAKSLYDFSREEDWPVFGIGKTPDDQEKCFLCGKVTEASAAKGRHETAYGWLCHDCIAELRAEGVALEFSD